MIEHEWYTDLGPMEDEVRPMLAEASAEDEEPGFPLVSLDRPHRAGSKHLLVWLQPDPRTGSQVPQERLLAAYLRLEPDDEPGAAVARYVVRPDYRSLGISTLLLETIGLDVRAEGGWVGTGFSKLRIWARGDHPAARRMSRRFRRYGIERTRREWQLLAPLRAGRDLGPPSTVPVRPLAGPAEQAAADELWRTSGRHDDDRPRDDEVLVAGDGADLHGAVWVDPDAGERTEYGTAGRIHAVCVHPAHADGPIRTSLLVAGMERLRDKGLRVAAITVDSQDRRLVADCRLHGFMHDRTDTEYSVA